METTPTPKPIIVTRHPALLAYLVERGLAAADVEVRQHVVESDVEGRDVIGVLPMHLAARCASVTVVDLDIPADQRGAELSLQQIREMVRSVTRYVVTVVEPPRTR